MQPTKEWAETMLNYHQECECEYRRWLCALMQQRGWLLPEESR
jgi:hypothetical protein